MYCHSIGQISQSRGNVDTLPHAGRLQHIEPRLLSIFKLGFDGSFDLSHLGTHKYGVSITVSVIFHEDLEGFIISIFADEISGAFR